MGTATSTISLEESFDHKQSASLPPRSLLPSSSHQRSLPPRSLPPRSLPPRSPPPRFPPPRSLPLPSQASHNHKQSASPPPQSLLPTSYNPPESKPSRIDKISTDSITKINNILKDRYRYIKNIENELQNSPNQLQIRRQIKQTLLKIMNELSFQDADITSCKKYFKNINEYEKNKQFIKMDKYLVELFKCLEEASLNLNKSQQKSIHKSTKKQTRRKHSTKKQPKRKHSIKKQLKRKHSTKKQLKRKHKK